jgi:PEP-CTERM motif
MRGLRTHVVRFGLMLVLVLGLLAVATPAHADTFNFTSDHCTGGCGTPPFGTVTVTQNGANVDIVVDLAAGYSYVQTGSADFQAFKFNAVDIVLGDITIDAHVPALVAATGAFNGNGTGEFDFGINCPSCANGGAGAFTADISFHIANATIADITAPNNLGNIFVADVLAPNGNTGPVDVSTPPVSAPEPASITLLGLGLFGAGLWARSQRKG